jgi:hypothetical protein
MFENAPLAICTDEGLSKTSVHHNGKAHFGDRGAIALKSLAGKVFV